MSTDLRYNSSMKLKNYSLILICILFLGFSSYTSAKEQFNYQHFTLENGLEVVVLPNTRAPVVYHSLWYKVGSADSPLNRSGLAHFLEHLMFNGSQKFPKDAFKRTVNDLGGNQNANTTWDRTGYFVTIAKEYLPIVMEMEADRMQNLVFTPEIIQKEKEVVLQERRSTSDAQPEALLGEAANASFFWQHPYGKPIIGFEEEIQQYTLEDAQAFYRQWYRPNNAILIIAGDVTLAQVKPLVETYYGKIPKGEIPKRIRPTEPTHRGATSKVEMRSPQLGASFQRLYQAPNHRTADIHTEAVLTLLENVLGDSTFGRLTKNLVENQKLANHAGAQYTGSFYDPYSFIVFAAPQNPADLAQLEASVESEIRRLIADGVTDAELTKAKEQWRFSARYRLDSLHGFADHIGENLALGYTLKDLETWLETLEKVTPEEVQNAAKDIFENGPAVAAYTHQVTQK